jgi:SAM-dependent methyltransferase
VSNGATSPQRVKSAASDHSGVVSLSEVCNPHRYCDKEWLAVHRELERYSIDKHCFLHLSGEIVRKGWEWTHCLYGLQKLGFVRPDAEGLGVGAGRECVIFYLADRIKRVVATDLYGNEVWQHSDGKEAPKAILDDPVKFCPAPFRTSAVTFLTADGTALPFDGASFDFCWSLSSIEHFGGHEAAAKAVREMIRVLKPGGIACVASELLLLDEQSHYEFFNRREVEQFVIGASPDADLADDMSWDLPPLAFLIDSIVFRPDEHGIHRRRRHVVMNNGQVQWTSFMVFLRKRYGSGTLPG